MIALLAAVYSKSFVGDVRKALPSSSGKWGEVRISAISSMDGEPVKRDGSRKNDRHRSLDGIQLLRQSARATRHRDKKDTGQPISYLNSKSPSLCMKDVQNLASRSGLGFDPGITTKGSAMRAAFIATQYRALWA